MPSCRVIGRTRISLIGEFREFRMPVCTTLQGRIGVFVFRGYSVRLGTWLEPKPPATFSDRSAVSRIDCAGQSRPLRIALACSVVLCLRTLVEPNRLLPVTRGPEAKESSPSRVMHTGLEM